MTARRCLMVFAAIAALAVSAGQAAAEKPEVAAGVDLYSRYVWRGLDIASTPSVQPAISVSYAGFELGTWGAYTLSNGSSESDEIDFWLSYTLTSKTGMSFTVIATDYYFPNAGVDFFNFNDYDAVDDEGAPDPGAHTIELGLAVTGPESFPVTLSGYVNVRNDAGNNTYFQVEYPFVAGDSQLGIFCGFAGGSEDNPDYYGTDGFAAINLGVSVARDIEVSETFSLPLSVSMILNPKAEISYLVAGMSF